jgi:hypothetical protein
MLTDENKTPLFKVGMVILVIVFSIMIGIFSSALNSIISAIAR